MSHKAHHKQAGDKKADFQTVLHEKLAVLEGWHRKIGLFGIVDRLPVTRLFIMIAILMGFLAAFANFEVRQSQYERWQANKDVTYLDNTPLFSTTDASYFLSLARQYNETGDVRDFQNRRLHRHLPQNVDDEKAQDSLFDFPLFSILIASVTRDNSTQSLLTTGNGLIPLLGFVLGLGILLGFGASGFWLEGAVAAIGAGLAPTFLVRSAIGRIDTDILNLGFFYAVLGLTIYAGRAASLRSAIAWTVGAALLLNLFFWWYDKAEFGWAFMVGLVWLSAITSRSWQRPLILGVIFVVLSGLALKSIGISTESSYFKDVSLTGALIFPNTFNTITELRVVPFDQIMVSITQSYGLGLVGVIGLVVFGIRHPVLAVVYGPATMFALANFLFGNRTIFYSAPMIWFGIAFLGVLMVRFAWRKAPAVIARMPHGETLAISALIAALMGGIYTTDRVQNFTPNPTFPKDVLRGFAATKQQLPDGAVIATWWDYGYASVLFNGYNILHDGGSQNTPVTHYFARAMLAKTQKETHGILRNLSSDGLRGIWENSATIAGAEAHITGDDYDPTIPVYLVLTEQMAGWMGSISNIGMWNLETGAPINAKNNPYGPTLFYNDLQCQSGERADAPICNGRVFDITNGTIGGQVAIANLTQATDGVISERTSLQPQAANVFHMARISEQGTRAMIMNKRLAQSSFHNLFHLGVVEDELFQLVYDDYPTMRIYVLK